MIIGIGEDLVDMRRIAKLYDRFPDRFLARCYSQVEIDKAMRRKNGGGHIDVLATRFAAKEAASKALGTGFSGGIEYNQISVDNDELGKPSLKLSGAAKKRLDSLVPQDMIANIHITLSDERPYAKALVIIEAIDGRVK